MNKRRGWPDQRWAHSYSVLLYDWVFNIPRSHKITYQAQSETPRDYQKTRGWYAISSWAILIKYKCDIILVRWAPWLTVTFVSCLTSNCTMCQVKWVQVINCITRFPSPVEQHIFFCKHRWREKRQGQLGYILWWWRCRWHRWEEKRISSYSVHEISKWEDFDKISQMTDLFRLISS